MAEGAAAPADCGGVKGGGGGADDDATKSARRHRCRRKGPARRGETPPSMPPRARWSLAGAGRRPTAAGAANAGACRRALVAAGMHTPMMQRPVACKWVVGRKDWGEGEVWGGRSRDGGGARGERRVRGRAPGCDRRRSMPRVESVARLVADNSTKRGTHSFKWIRQEQAPPRAASTARRRPPPRGAPGAPPGLTGCSCMETPPPDPGRRRLDGGGWTVVAGRQRWPPRQGTAASGAGTP